MSSEADIIIVRDRIDPDQLRRLVRLFFEDMVKYVVDVEEGIAAVGGELHADAEARLLEIGCEQQNLWGANYYPDLDADECIEFTALINIRPSQDNPSMEILDTDVRARVRELTYALLGRGRGHS